jgi:hypothetical protein
VTGNISRRAHNKQAEVNGRLEWPSNNAGQYPANPPVSKLQLGRLTTEASEQLLQFYGVPAAANTHVAELRIMLYRHIGAYESANQSFHIAFKANNVRTALG